MQFLATRRMDTMSFRFRRLMERMAVPSMGTAGRQLGHRAAPEPDGSEASALLGWRVALLYRAFFPAFVMSFPVAGLLAFILWPSCPHWAVALWAAAMCVVTAARGLLCRSYFRANPPPARSGQWLFGFTLGAGAAGIAWGVAGALFLRGGVAMWPASVLVPCVLAGVAAAAAAGMLSAPGAFLAIALPLLGLPALAATAWGGPLGLEIAVLCLLYLVTLVGLTHKACGFVTEWAEANLRNEALVERLEASNRLLSAEREALQRSRAILEKAQNIGRIGSWDLDVASGKMTCSEEIYRIFEIDPDCVEISPAHFLDAVHPDDLERVKRMCLSSESQLDAFEIEYRLLFPDGGIKYLHLCRENQYGVDGGLCSSIGTVQDVSERRQAEEQLNALAFRDPLTGLANRTLFLERLRKSLAEGLRHGRKVALLMIDLDRFKTVNDSFGHNAGDRLLVEVAKRLKQSVRDCDTVARLGGDEFAAILPEIREPMDAALVAAKIVGAISAPVLLDEGEVFVSASVGIAGSPLDSRDADTLLRYADAALYHAKSSGRGTFQFYSHDLTRRAESRIALESDLSRALERGELELHFQPKVYLGNGALAGAEALLRWRHPERGLVSPDNFVGIAEDTGLIVPIGEWVLREACAVASRWNVDAADAPLKIAVNLSARQFLTNDLAGLVAAVLEETGCSPEWIELEITESLLLDERGEVLATLERFRELGLSIAIDDFGTGYSALGYLTRFPIDVLKIDRSFVDDVIDDTQRTVVVKAIVSMGRSLCLGLVAEGVETMAQAEFLHALGCRLAQGWLFGKAVPAAEFEQVWIDSPEAKAVRVSRTGRSLCQKVHCPDWGTPNCRTFDKGGQDAVPVMIAERDGDEPQGLCGGRGRPA